MIKKWIFAAGAGIGYVLGTKAGREKYEKMRMQARQVLENPTVKEATDTVQTEATRLKEGGLQAFRHRMRQLRHRAELDEGVSAITPVATTRDATALPPTTTTSSTRRPRRRRTRRRHRPVRAVRRPNPPRAEPAISLGTA